VLEQMARGASPRVTPCGCDAVVFDVAGLSRVCGSAEVIAREVVTQADARGLVVRLAIAGTLTAAWVLAHARTGTTVVPSGGEAMALAPLPLGWLIPVIELDRCVGCADVASDTRKAGSELTRYRECLATFERWGLRTCADLATLPRADIHARMGPAGVRLHQAATGEDVAPLVPSADARVFADRADLEWPIEGLEPLSFVLARQCERLSVSLEQADRGAVAIHTTLTLVTRETHRRVLVLPAPMRDPKVLRTLILLDLESHPPAAAIDVVDLRLDVTPGRIVQGSLLARAVPSPEQVSTLIARLTALVGEGRVGAPVLLDTHDGRPCALVPFRTPSDTTRAGGASTDLTAADARAAPHLRRLRLPIAARVVAAQGRPARVVVAHAGMGGEVRVCAGPWRTSGAWWDVRKIATWDRDEWDVELAGGAVYRLVRHRDTGQWEIDGIFD
jgi:protein ImuB